MEIFPRHISSSVVEWFIQQSNYNAAITVLGSREEKGSLIRIQGDSIAMSRWTRTQMALGRQWATGEGGRS